MIFIDTSAVVAMMLREADGKHVAKILDSSGQCYTGAHVRLETVMVVSSRLKTTPDSVDLDYQDILDVFQIKVLDLTDDLSKMSVTAFAKYGKGRKHKAQLNLADCMSYALAKSGNMKMLFVGKDFAHTDVAKA